MEDADRPGHGPTSMRLFRHAQTAVSPVISTILMVAITVVLAATAFVLVAGIADDTGEVAIPLGLTVDDAEDLMRVTSTGQGADWVRIELLVRDDGSGSIFLGGSAGRVSQSATDDGLEITATQPRVSVAESPTPILGGDWLSFCRAASGTDGPIEIDVIDVVANQRLGTYNFGGLEACPP